MIGDMILKGWIMVGEDYLPACSEGQKQKPRQKLTRIFLRLPRGKRYDRNDPRRQPERLPKRNRLRVRPLRRKEADPQRSPQQHKESNGMKPETLDKWKIVPRIMLFVMTGYTSGALSTLSVLVQI